MVACHMNKYLLGMSTLAECKHPLCLPLLGLTAQACVLDSVSQGGVVNAGCLNTCEDLQGVSCRLRTCHTLFPSFVTYHPERITSLTRSPPPPPLRTTVDRPHVGTYGGGVGSLRVRYTCTRLLFSQNIHAWTLPGLCQPYRGTSLIRNCHPP